MSTENDDHLHLVNGVVLGIVQKDGPDLSARQIVVLLTVYLDPTPQTVRGLAELLAVSKPAITRALDRLGELDFVRRKKDPADGRSIHAVRTPNGANFVQHLRNLAAAVQQSR